MVNNDKHHNEDDLFDNPTGAMVTMFKSLMEAGTNGGISLQDLPQRPTG